MLLINGILKANVKILIFILYNKMLQKSANVLPAYCSCFSHEFYFSVTIPFSEDTPMHLHCTSEGPAYENCAIFANALTDDYPRLHVICTILPLWRSKHSFVSLNGSVQGGLHDGGTILTQCPTTLHLY